MSQGEPTRMHVTFGAIVADHRKRTGLNQERFAERAGISRVYLSLIERNQAPNLSANAIAGLARAMGVDEGELFRLYVAEYYPILEAA